MAEGSLGFAAPVNIQDHMNVCDAATWTTVEEATPLPLGTDIMTDTGHTDRVGATGPYMTYVAI